MLTYTCILGLDNRLGTIAHMKFAENITDPVAYGFGAEPNLLGNYSIGQPLREEGQNGALALGQLREQGSI